MISKCNFEFTFWGVFPGAPTWHIPDFESMYVGSLRMTTGLVWWAGAETQVLVTRDLSESSNPTQIPPLPALHETSQEKKTKTWIWTPSPSSLSSKQKQTRRRRPTGGHTCGGRCKFGWVWSSLTLGPGKRSPNKKKNEWSFVSLQLEIFWLTVDLLCLQVFRHTVTRISIVSKKASIVI